jgi:hypothetical protein
LFPEKPQRGLGIRWALERQEDLFQIAERAVQNQFGAESHAQDAMRHTAEHPFFYRPQAPGSHDDQICMVCLDCRDDLFRR